MYPLFDQATLQPITINQSPIMTPGAKQFSIQRRPIVVARNIYDS